MVVSVGRRMECAMRNRLNWGVGDGDGYDGAGTTAGSRLKVRAAKTILLWPDGAPSAGR